MKLEYHLTVKELNRYFTYKFDWMVMLIIVCVFVVGFQSVNQGMGFPWIGMAVFVTTIVLVYALIVGLLSFWCKPAVIEITNIGIRETMNGKTKQWAWHKVGDFALDERYLTIKLGASTAIIPIEQVGVTAAMDFYHSIYQQKRL
ncbi:hypothetical protein U0021_08035 [Moraxella canis]|uniref:YcxB-like protein domain-containing protein n=1 Tax=Moraxella canis TaxID=90239 RepID=A0ABZ0WXB9_9GAMM|nr:hypothetical protein [Moraxella canis]WQE03683.1 hypothetical protein U0021_08035 [Moraxella canis]